MARIPGAVPLPTGERVIGRVTLRFTVRRRWLLLVWYVTPTRPSWLLRRAVRIEAGC